MIDSNPAALKIEIRPSLILAGILGAAHVLALAAALLSLPGWAGYLVASGVVLSAAASLAKVLQLLPASVVSLELFANGCASWRDRRGLWHEGGFGGGHYVSAVLVVVGLRSAGRQTQPLVLAADSASAEDMRRLRVWLRWRGDSA
jgi:hypothetical protein